MDITHLNPISREEPIQHQKAKRLKLRIKQYQEDAVARGISVSPKLRHTSGPFFPSHSQARAKQREQ